VKRNRSNLQLIFILQNQRKIIQHKKQFSSVLEHSQHQKMSWTN